METELKLLVDPGDVAAFRRHALLKQHAIEKPHQQLLTSIYFDTPDLYFRRHGASLRVRQLDGCWVQTLKGSTAPSAGLYQRDEWETPVESAYPDLGALARLVKHDAGWSGMLADSALAKPLVTVFTTRVKRTIWMLRLEQGDDVELALDQGAVEHDKTHLPISEIELELKSGDPAHLFDFALELQNTVPVKIGSETKAELGFSLCVPQPSNIAKAGPLKLKPRMTVEQGFELIVDNCLAQIEGNARAVVQGNDPEGVHQMRVGLRRLHSVLGLFQEIAPCPDALQAEFKWLGEQLGAARDWEVLAGATLAVLLEKYPERTELVQLQGRASALAAEKRELAAQALSSLRYTRLLLAFRSWMAGSRWRDSPGKAQRDVLFGRIAKFADDAVDKAHFRLLKRGKNLRKLDPEKRHRMRIAAKKVRYATEFFRLLYRPGKVKTYLNALSGLQDTLGKVNDARVAAGLLQKIGDSDPGLVRAAGFAEGWLAAQSEAGISALSREWKQFKAVPVN